MSIEPCDEYRPLTPTELEHGLVKAALYVVFADAARLLKADAATAEERRDAQLVVEHLTKLFKESGWDDMFPASWEPAA